MTGWLLGVMVGLAAWAVFGFVMLGRGARTPEPDLDEEIRELERDLGVGIPLDQRIAEAEHVHGLPVGDDPEHCGPCGDEHKKRERRKRIAACHHPAWSSAYTEIIAEDLCGITHVYEHPARCHSCGATQDEARADLQRRFEATAALLHPGETVIRHGIAIRYVGEKHDWLNDYDGRLACTRCGDSYIPGYNKPTNEHCTGEAE